MYWYDTILLMIFSQQCLDSIFLGYFVVLTSQMSVYSQPGSSYLEFIKFNDKKVAKITRFTSWCFLIR